MFFAKKVIVALAAAMLVGEAAAAAPTKYTTAGYSSYAWAYWDTCSVNDGSYFDVSVYSSQSKTKAAGGNNKSTDQYENLYLYFTFVTSCDGDTVNYVTGSAYEWSYNVKPVFTIESKKLTSASLKDVKVPVLSYSCTYSCYEVCYAEWWGYGTCPPEPTYTECSPSCTYPEETGVATVNVNWSDSSNTALSQSTSSYRFKDSYGFYAYRSKGSSRDAPVTISVAVDGVTILPGTAAYSYGSLSSTTEMNIAKYSY
jgi:hypothetical protein